MCTLIPLSPRGRFRSSSPWPEGHWTPGRGHVPSLCPGQRHIGGCPRRAGYRNDAVGRGMSALRLLERRIRDLSLCTPHCGQRGAWPFRRVAGWLGR